jgi:hypothetical protein
MASFDKKLSGLLLKSGKVNPEDLDRLQGISARDRRRLSELVVSEKIMDGDELLGLIAIHSNVPPINLERVKVSEEVRDILPEEVAHTQQVVPLDKIGDYLTLAVTDPFDVLKLDDIRIITGCELRPGVALEESVEQAIDERLQVRSRGPSRTSSTASTTGTSSSREQDEDDEGMDLSAISDEASPSSRWSTRSSSDAVNPEGQRYPHRALRESSRRPLSQRRSAWPRCMRCPSGCRTT